LQTRYFFQLAMATFTNGPTRDYEMAALATAKSDRREFRHLIVLYHGKEDLERLFRRFYKDF
jgi:hypothetical protein